MLLAAAFAAAQRVRNRRFRTLWPRATEARPTLDSPRARATFTALTANANLRRALLDAGVVDADRLARAEGTAQSRGQPLERALVALGMADEVAVWRCLAKVHGLKFVDPQKLVVQPEALKKLPVEQLLANEALPVLFKDGVLWLAIDDPVKSFVADNLAFLAGCTVQCALMPPTALKDQLRKLGGGSAAGGAAGKTAGAQAESEDAPIIRLVQKTLEEALGQRASDVHVEPFPQRVRVRYRIDGVLKEIASHPNTLLAPLT